MDADDPRWTLLARCPSLTADLVPAALVRLGGGYAPLPPGIAAQLGRAGADREALAADRAWLAAAPRRRLVPCTSPDYPPLLRTIADAPPVLWVEGRVDALHAPQVAVVGTRRPTPTGRELARAWSRRFAQAGLVVTSGLAAGIDACAHRGALAVARDGGATDVGGSDDAPTTIAVCGTGLASTYPPEHAELAREIVAHGALVSEFPPHLGPRPRHFPRRNRILSGLALGTLVVEAAARSGSLITARLAGEQGREVWAIPGSALNPMARGCHALLRQGARLVETADEVLAELASSPLAAGLALAATASAASPRRATTPCAGAGAAPQPLDKAGEMLLDALGFEPLDVDTLAERTGLAAQAVSSMLLILELQGRVEPRAGRFCRASPQGTSPLAADWSVDAASVGGASLAAGTASGGHAR